MWNLTLTVRLFWRPVVHSGVVFTTLTASLSFLLRLCVCGCRLVLQVWGMYMAKLRIIFGMCNTVRCSVVRVCQKTLLNVADECINVKSDAIFLKITLQKGVVTAAGRDCGGSGEEV